MPKNGILESNYDFILGFINHSLPRSPFPVPFLVGWEKTPRRGAGAKSPAAQRSTGAQRSCQGPSVVTKDGW